jgi:transcriptional regulator with PAS, ATPase and Fis domain
MSSNNGLSIITYSKKHMENVISQLTNLLGDGINIKGYSIQEGINEEICDSLVLICHKYLREEALKYIAPGANVLVARRSLNHSKLEDILQIPEGEKVLFVDVNKSLTESSISLLVELGINHIKMYPYYPGQESSEYADYSITTGEAHLVPNYVKNVIDIGYSKIDLTTITEIMINLGIMDERANLLSSRYLQDFAYSSKKIVETLSENNHITEQLNTILNVINDGIVGIDGNGEIMFSNYNANKLFNNTDKINLNDINNFDIMSFQGKTFDIYREIHEIKGKKVLLTMMPIIEDNSNNGIIITFKDLSEIIEMENIVRSNLFKKGHTAKYNFSDIVGKSKNITETIEIAKKLSRSNSTLLLTGESGTGKELFAHSIHNASKQQHGPFVAANFAALTESLLESELFGYEEGAFTGARKGGHAGLFEQAHKGTIFLDEIGDASPRIQARLLRVLQEKEVLRIGGTKILPIDVRVVASTNKDLHELVQKGDFREDLYYRLNVLPINIPPLRERKSDIPLLVKMLLKKFPYGNEMVISNEVLTKFMEYDWPGNVRELENVIEYLYNLAGSKIELKDLPLDLEDGKKQQDVQIQEQQIQNETTLKDLEKEIPLQDVLIILRALKNSKDEGNAYIGRKKLAGLLNYEFTEQMIRSRLEILSQAGFVITKRGPKGTRLLLNGEKYLDLLEGILS